MLVRKWRLVSRARPPSFYQFFCPRVNGLSSDYSDDEKATMSDNYIHVLFTKLIRMHTLFIAKLLVVSRSTAVCDYSTHKRPRKQVHFLAVIRLRPYDVSLLIAMCVNWPMAISLIIELGYTWQSIDSRNSLILHAHLGYVWQACPSYTLWFYVLFFSPHYCPPFGE